MFGRYTLKAVVAGALLALNATPLAAQDALVKTANHHYETLCYVKAIDAYEQALKRGLKGDEATSAKIRLAESYFNIKDMTNAERLYREVVGSGISLGGENALVVLRYAQALASNGNYAESQKVYDQYTSLAAQDSRGKNFSKLYNDVSVLSKNAACYKIDYVTINTNAAEFSPTYYKNGIIFVSNRNAANGVRRVFNWNNTPFLDLYHLEDISVLGSQTAAIGTGGSDATVRSKTRYVGSEQYTPASANDSRTIGSYGNDVAGWGIGYGEKSQTPVDRFNTLNSKYHEGPAAFMKDGSRVFFTRNNFLKGRSGKSSDGVIKLKIYTADADGSGFKNIRELPFNSDEYSTGHPALSPDETLLFFASDMPGGFGGTDLYVSRFNGSDWSAPINLGKDVNTKGNEMFPYVDEKGGLYFSSDGHPGLGELDIFYAQLDGVAPKGRITNLGSPINSSKDDFGLITDGQRQTGYFSSNRKRGGNDDDVYRFDRECELKEGCELLISVFDAETKMPLNNVKVVYEDKKGNLQQGTTNENGTLAIESLTLDEEFTFRATHTGYSPNTVSFTTDDCGNEPSRLEIPMARPQAYRDSVALANQPAPTTPTGTTGTSSSYTSGSTTTGETITTTTGTTMAGNRCLITGRVLAQNGNAGLSGIAVTLRSECDGSSQTTYTDASGNYQFEVVEGCSYTVEGTTSDMASKGKRIRNVSCSSGPINADIYMFGQGDIVQIDNIYFDYGRCNLRPDAKSELDKLVSMMRQYPKMRIELRSHTDSRSSSEFNEMIANGRAKASANYLFKRGISRSRVEYKGYGETMPVNGCVDGVECTEEQHAQNRRTEIRILQMN